MVKEQQQSDDERRLAELGYSQALQRSWSSFSNFAISFTIISVLAGCFTTYGQAWNNGGPIAISWGWPIICGLILLVAFSMSELVSAYPTAGGIYYWASTLGGPKWGWFTGWFNLVGLVGVVASVDYGCATFLNASFMLFGVDLGFANWGDTSHILTETFLLFIAILTLHALINIYSSPLVAMLNNVSVFWHVVGVAAIILVLIFVPDQHQSVDFVFTETINNSGFGENMFWFYVLPLGFLLTMYTQTGYDASAHISEETHGAAKAAAQGVWRSVFWSGVGGWFVLLAITFAATDVDGINEGFGSSLAVFAHRDPGRLGEVRRGHRHDRPALLRHGLRDLVLAHDVRLLARPRGAGLADLDAAEPPPRAGLRRHRLLRRGRADDRAGAQGDEAGAPYAFFAVVSICVIGLYIAYVIPVFLRWRMGDAFQPGPWTLGRHYRWVNPAAVIWVGICVIIFCLPFTPAAVPWRDEFDIKYFNYAPVTVGGAAADRGRLVGGARQAHVQGPGADGRVRRGRRRRVSDR